MSSALISLGEALHLLMPAAVRSNGKHRRSRSMPDSTAHPILADLQNQLRAKVETLMEQQQQPECYNFSAAWLGQALDVVLFSYSNLKDLYPHMQIETNNDGKWLSQHMEDLVNLLGVCNVLRESMSEMKKHNMSVEIALHGLLHSHAQIPSVLSHHDHIINNPVVKAKDSLDKCRDDLRKNIEYKLEKCMSALKRMADSPHPTAAVATSISGSGVEEAIKEAKGITVFACTVLVAALSYNTPRRSFMPGADFVKRKNSISPSPLPPLIDTNSMTNMMQHRIKEAMEMQRKRASSFKFPLHELNSVDITLGNLNNLLDRYIMNKMSKSSSNMQDELKDSIYEVSMSITELDSALTHMDHKINDLFRFLISSRVALLNNLSIRSS